MKSSMIGYDLYRSGQNYSSLYEATKEVGTWWHHLDSTWLVKSDLTAAQIRDRLTPHIDADDELLVAGLTGEGAWRGFNDRGSSWLKNNL